MKKVISFFLVFVALMFTCACEYQPSIEPDEILVVLANQSNLSILFNIEQGECGSFLYALQDQLRQGDYIEVTIPKVDCWEFRYTKSNLVSGDSQESSVVENPQYGEYYILEVVD